MSPEYAVNSCAVFFVSSTVVFIASIVLSYYFTNLVKEEKHTIIGYHEATKTLFENQDKKCNYHSCHIDKRFNRLHKIFTVYDAGYSREDILSDSIKFIYDESNSDDNVLGKNDALFVNHINRDLYDRRPDKFGIVKRKELK